MKQVKLVYKKTLFEKIKGYNIYRITINVIDELIPIFIGLIGGILFIPLFFLKCLPICQKKEI